MKFVLLVSLVVSIPFISPAVEHDFNRGAITSTTGLTTQPASLGFLKGKMSFSASATTFEKENYNISNSNFKDDEQPLSLKPVFVGSALSTENGGWSLLIFSTNFKYRAEGNRNDQVGFITDSDLNLQIDSIHALVSTGYRLTPHLALGGSIAFSQRQVSYSSTSRSLSTTIDTFSTSETRQQTQSLQLSLGLIYMNDFLVIGAKLNSSSVLLNDSAESRVRLLTVPLPSGSPTYFDQTRNEKTAFESKESIESGIKFAWDRWNYLISHDYILSGLHSFSMGLEHKANWGTLSTSYQVSDYNRDKRTFWTIGFIQDKGSFKWGIGPFIRETKATNSGDFETQTYGLLYSSEIRF